MDVTRVSAAGSVAAPTPSVGPSASEVNRKSRGIGPAAIVQLRSRFAESLEGARGGHAVQEAGNRDEVSLSGLQRLRGLLERGFKSMEGGHKVQQITFEPTVSTTELVDNIETIESNVMDMAGGSQVQHEVRNPSLADSFVREGKKLAAEISSQLQSASKELPKVQARGIDRNAVARILG